MSLRAWAAMIAIIAGAPAIAQTNAQVEARYSRDFKQCMRSGDAAEGITAGIMDCNGAEIDRQDARLNQAYKMVMQKLTVPQKATLRLSERNWITQRDARCRRSMGDEAGGSLGGIINSGCILDETIRRTMWLEVYRA